MDNGVQVIVFALALFASMNFAQEALLDFASMEGPEHVNITWGQNTTIRTYVYDTDGSQATPDEGTNFSARAVDMNTRQQVIPAVSFVNNRYELYYFGRNPGEYMVYANISKGDRQRNAGPVYVTVYRDRGNLSYVYLTVVFFRDMHPGERATVYLDAYDTDGTSSTEAEGTNVSSEITFNARDGSSRSLGGLSFRYSGGGTWTADFSPQEVGNYTINAYATKAGATRNDSERIEVVSQDEGNVLDRIEAWAYPRLTSTRGNSTITVYAYDVDESYATPAEGTSFDASLSLTQGGNTRNLGAVQFQNQRNTSWSYFFQPNEAGNYTFSITVRKNGIERTGRTTVEAIPGENAQALDRVHVSTSAWNSMWTGESYRITLSAYDADGSSATPDEGTSVSGSVIYSYNGRTQDLGALQFNYSRYWGYEAYFTPTEEGNYTFRGAATKAGIARNASTTVRAVNNDMANVLDRVRVYTYAYNIRAGSEVLLYADAYDYDGSTTGEAEGASITSAAYKDGARVATLSFSGRWGFSTRFTPQTEGNYNISVVVSKNGIERSSSYLLRVYPANYGNNLASVSISPSTYYPTPGQQVTLTAYAYDDDWSYATPDEGTSVSGTVSTRAGQQLENIQFSYSNGRYTGYFSQNAEGDYSVTATASKNGRQNSSTTTLTVTSSGNNRQARASFSSTPSGARVKITNPSGRNVYGDSYTPYSLNLPYGDYVAEFSLVGYESYTMSLSIRTPTSSDYHADLVKKEKPAEPQLSSAKLSAFVDYLKPGQKTWLFLYAKDEDGTDATPEEGTSIGYQLVFYNQSPYPSTDISYLSDFVYSQNKGAYVANLSTSIAPGKYEIYATARKGEAEKNSNTITVRSVLPQKLSFNAGWNQVSLPVNEIVPLSSFIYSGNCKPTSSLWEYTGRQYVKSDSFAPGAGYWLRMQGDCSVELSGNQLLKYPEKDLVKGWNMIGAPFSIRISNDCTPGPNVACTQVMPKDYTQFPEIAGTCNPNSMLYNYDAKQNKYFQTRTLVPGQAYWIKSDSACTLGVQAPPPVPN